MRFIKLLQEFEVAFSGGLAIYALMCVIYVTISGLIQIIKWVLSRISYKSQRTNDVKEETDEGNNSVV